MQVEYCGEWLPAHRDLIEDVLVTRLTSICYCSGMKINSHLSIVDREIELKAIRSQGAGGQKVNKTSSAIHLSFNIHQSSLSAFHKHRLLSCGDSRITDDGIVIIKAQEFRTQKANKKAALERLADLINKAIKVEKKRRATKPTYGSKQRRMDKKTKHGKKKELRKKLF